MTSRAKWTNTKRKNLSVRLEQISLFFFFPSPFGVTSLGQHVVGEAQAEDLVMCACVCHLVCKCVCSGLRQMGKALH